jgi:hypothetical protein
MDPGVTPSVPLEIVTLPVRETVTVASEAFEISVSAASSVPEVVGENVTDIFAAVPDARL